jgi:Gpi18-like mannosyltransferase
MACIRERFAENQLFSRMNGTLLKIAIIGIVIRLALIPFAFSFDASFWIITGAGFESNRTLYESGNFYYLPPFGYILAVLTAIWSLLPFESGTLALELVSGSNFSSVPYTMVTSLSFNLFYSIPLTIFDLISSWLVYSIVLEKTDSRRKANLGFALFFLSPLIIWSSSIAYMFDSLSAMFMLITIYALMKDQYGLAGASLALATLTKVFPILISFAVLLYVISKNETIRSTLRNLAVFLSGFVASAIFIMLPVFLKGEMGRSLIFLSSRAEESAQATGGLNLIDLILYPMPDKIFVVMPFLLFMIVLSTFLIFLSKGDNDKKLVMASLMSVTMFFLFPPISTYPVIAIPLLALAAVYYGEKLWLIPWVLFSVLMPIHAIAIFGNTILYPLAAGTGLFDLQTMVNGYYGFLQTLYTIQGYTLLALYVPAVSCLVIAAYSFMKPYRSNQYG